MAGVGVGSDVIGSTGFYESRARASTVDARLRAGAPRRVGLILASMHAETSAADETGSSPGGGVLFTLGTTTATSPPPFANPGANPGAKPVSNMTSGPFLLGVVGGGLLLLLFLIILSRSLRRMAEVRHTAAKATVTRDAWREAGRRLVVPPRRPDEVSGDDDHDRGAPR